MTAIIDRLKNLFAEHKIDVIIIAGLGFVAGHLWGSFLGWIL